MYRKIIAITSAVALAVAINASSPVPAKAFFVLPVVAAAAMFGAFAAGGVLSSATSGERGVAGHTGCRTRSGSTYDPQTGVFTGQWAMTTVCDR
jgi:hypothetical protein